MTGEPSGDVGSAPSAACGLAEIDRRLALLRAELAGGGQRGDQSAGPGASLPSPRGRSAGPLARALAREHPAGRSAAVELRAGPFADPEAVRAFARLLGELRAVADVRLAGYEGADRAILEVTLVDRSSAGPDRGSARRGPAQSA